MLRVTLPLSIVKTPTIKPGKPLTWAGVVSNTNRDGQGEVIEKSLLSELVSNFNAILAGEGPARAQELRAKGWSGPILDPGHFSLLLGPDKRDGAKIGTIDQVYLDGNVLKAKGTFDNSDLAWSVIKNMAGRELQTSICFWAPPEAIVKETDGVHYRGGTGEAFIDSVGLTTIPVNRSTNFTAVAMSEADADAGDLSLLRDDLLAVVGPEETEKLFSLLSAEVGAIQAEAKSAALGDAMDPKTNPTPAADVTLGDVVAQLDAQADAQAPAVAPKSDALTADVVKALIAEALAGLQASAPVAAAPAAPAEAAPVAPVAAPAPVPTQVALSQAVSTGQVSINANELLQMFLQVQEATVKSMAVNPAAPVRRSFATPPAQVDANGQVVAAAPQAPSTMSDVVSALDQRRAMLTGYSG